MWGNREADRVHVRFVVTHDAVLERAFTEQEARVWTLKFF